MATVSLCMIVRNEAERLPGFLDTIEPVGFDQVVIVDTGSTDSTVQILNDHGAEVVDFPWCDDFAAARNAGLEVATSDWILVLDADERLEPGALEHLRSLAVKADSDTWGLVVNVRNYTEQVGDMEWLPVEANDQERRDAVAYYPTEVVRFFRNDERVRYRGRVHELVEPSIEAEGGRYESSDAVVHHTLSGSTAKGDWYLELQKLKVADEPDSAKAHWELGVQYLRVGQVDAGTAALEHAWQLAPGNVEVGLNLALALNDAGRSKEAIQVLREVRDDSGSDPRIEFQLGQAFLVLGLTDEAMAAFDSAQARAPHLPQPRYWRARLLMQSDRDAALEVVSSLLEEVPQFWQGWLLKSELALAEQDVGGARGCALEGIRGALGGNESLKELEGFLKRIPLSQHEFRCRLFTDLAAPETCEPFARALRSFGDREALGAFAAQVLENGNGSPEIRYDLAEYHLLRGELNEATEILGALLQEPAVRVKAGYRLARVLIDNHHVQPGAELLQQVLHVEPDHVLALIDLAGMHGNSGRLAEARELLTRAAQLEPRNSLIHHNLAIAAALEEPPQMELATEHWQRAKDLGHPPDAELERRLVAHC